MIKYLNYIKNIYDDRLKLFILIIFISQILLIPSHSYAFDNWDKTEFDRYMELSKGIIGTSTGENNIRVSQLQPIFSLLIIPCIFMDTITHLILLNTILMTGLFIALYLLANQHMDRERSLSISFIITMFVIVFFNMYIGSTMILCMALFTYFVYSLTKEDKKHISLSSIVFAILVLTKFLFLYLGIFTILWFVYKRKIRKYPIWILPTFIGIGLWMVRNYFVRGNEVNELLGGYYVIPFGNTTFLNIHFNLMRFINSLYVYEHTLVITFMFISLFFLYILSKRNKVYYLFIVNFIVFFVAPCMTWNSEFMVVRYLMYMLPAYLVFIFVCLLHVCDNTDQDLFQNHHIKQNRL